MRTPVAIDPNETWTVDFCLESARHAVETWKQVVEQAKADAAALPATLAPELRRVAENKLTVTQAALAQAEKSLAEYVPGSGPFFTLGHIPDAKRAEIAGMMDEVDRALGAPARAAAQHAWRRELIRWTVRGHRNLRYRSGEEVPFTGASLALASRTITGPTDDQIDRYGTFIADLAAVCMEAQRLPETEKNA